MTKNKKLLFTAYGAGFICALQNLSTGLFSPIVGGLLLASIVLGYVLEFYEIGD